MRSLTAQLPLSLSPFYFLERPAPHNRSIKKHTYLTAFYNLAILNIDYDRSSMTHVYKKPSNKNVSTSYRDKRGPRVGPSLAVGGRARVLPPVLPSDAVDAQLSVLDFLPAVGGKGNATCRQQYKHACYWREEKTNMDADFTYVSKTGGRVKE